jgi:hypothetical protein
MPITLDGSLGITTPSYGGTDPAEYLVPVTGFKNRIINGAMQIDQRNAGASVNITATQYTLDRWSINSTQSTKISVQRNAGSVTPPEGFSNYLGVTSLSAFTLGAADFFGITQSIEGFNTVDLDFGKASAKTVTLSFWVRSSLTGAFGGCLLNGAVNRSYPFSYTISSANTWEQKSITISGDTSGTWVGSTNGTGLQISLNLGTGSTYSGTAGSWIGSLVLAPTGATSVVGTNGATFYITGVQLEKGSTATSFDYRPYTTELQLCQRYYWKSTQSANTNGGLGFAIGNGSGYGRWQFNLPVQMRATPTITQSNMTLYNFSSSANITSISANFSTVNNISVDGAASGAVGSNTLLLVYMNGALAYADASAEL